MTKKQINTNFGYNYSSIQNVIKAYFERGRTNKIQYLQNEYHQKGTKTYKRGRKKLDPNFDMLKDVFGSLNH